MAQRLLVSAALIVKNPCCLLCLLSPRQPAAGLPALQELSKRPTFDAACQEFHQRFPALGFKSNWEEIAKACGPSTPDEQHLPWDERYDAVEEGMRAAGRWPAPGQPLVFTQGGCASEHEKSVARRRFVSVRGGPTPFFLFCSPCSATTHTPPSTLLQNLLMRHSHFDAECEEFDQRFPACSFRSEWEGKAGARAEAELQTSWAWAYDKAEKAMCEAGCWPAPGQPLVFRFKYAGKDVSEEERRVARRHAVSTLPECPSPPTEQPPLMCRWPPRCRTF
jgi:hypothetical protein